MNLSYVNLQSFGEALEEKFESRSQDLREVIESKYLPGVVEYELVRVVYDPKERYFSGSVISRESFRAFTKATP